MRRIVLFGEDSGHEKFITAVIERFSHEYAIPVRIIPRSVRGGYGKVVSEFKSFLHDILKDKASLPDLLIVATDANCKRFNARRKEIDEINTELKEFTLYAVADPHIERWLLLDSSAFKAAVGKGCNAPDLKCDRDRYKKKLMEEMQSAGIVPPLGGLEYAEDIVNAMNFQQIRQSKDSLGIFLKDLTTKFDEWKTPVK